MIGKTTITASTGALAAVGFIIVACSDKADGGGGGDEGGSMAGSGMTTGGTAPNGGGSGTGTTGGSTSGGSTTGGSTSGGAGGAGAGAGGVSGSGGAGGGAAAMGPYACATPKAATCGAINDFATASTQSWGIGEFSGGVSVFPQNMPTTITRDTDTTKIHVTGMVSNYGVGFVLWFTYCSSLAAYDGITFTISGTTTDMPMNTIDFQLQTNANYPWQASPADGKGFCTAVDAMNPWGMCISPSINISLATTPTVFTWAQMMGGMPTPWSAATSPGELIGIQWQFPWAPSRAPYTFDVTLDNVTFSGGSGPSMACPPYMPSTGGMGGIGGAGAGAGGAPAGAGGAGAGRGGMAGAAGALAGAGGAGAGRGGMAGAGGT